MDEVFLDHGRPVMEVNIGTFSTIAMFICGLVYAVEVLVPRSVPYLALSAQWVWARPWTLVTHIFAHGSMNHLLMNLFGLFLFGFILEKQIGSKEFTALFFASGLIAGIGQMTASPVGYSLGASGALFGILGMLAVLKPKMLVFVSSIPVPMIVAAAGWFIGEWIMLGIGRDGIGHAAHLGGLVLGLLFGIYWRVFRLQAPPEHQLIVE